MLRNWYDSIKAERERQINDEGFTPEQDDGYVDEELADAAAAYAASEKQLKLWPVNWNLSLFKRKNRKHDLVRAAALIVAELERLDREEIRAQS